MPDTQPESRPSDERERRPAYVGYTTFETFLDWLGEMDPIPRQLDRSLWGSKFSGGNGAQLMVGLRFLGLLDGEQPMETLVTLAKANPDQRTAHLQAVIRNAYGSHLVDDLAEMTPRLVDSELRKLGTTEATHRKALSFFINAAKAADVSMQPSVAKRARKRALGTGAKSVKVRTRSNAANPQKPKDALPPSADGNRAPLDDLRSEYVQMLIKTSGGVGGWRSS